MGEHTESPNPNSRILDRRGTRKETELANDEAGT